MTLPASTVLMDAVGAAMDEAGCDSGVMILDNLVMGRYRYVMPGPSNDDTHAAWYSAKHEGQGARLRHATAVIGKRNDAWWLHCHAVWGTDRIAKSGHLLPDEVMIGEDAQVVLHTFDGGSFAVQHDAETNFDIFHVIGGSSTGNALIAKFAPHEDTATAIATLAHEAQFDEVEVVGVGSLIGATFEGSEVPMASPISEVLITPGASVTGGKTDLPIYCVDPDNGQFSGKLAQGGGPVCVTFELMLIEV